MLLQDLTIKSNGQRLFAFASGNHGKEFWVPGQRDGMLDMYAGIQYSDAGLIIS